MNNETQTETPEFASFRLDTLKKCVRDKLASTAECEGKGLATGKTAKVILMRDIYHDMHRIAHEMGACIPSYDFQPTVTTNFQITAQEIKKMTSNPRLRLQYSVGLSALILKLNLAEESYVRQLITNARKTLNV